MLLKAWHNLSCRKKETGETELDDMLRISLKNGKRYVENYLMDIMSGLKYQ